MNNYFRFWANDRGLYEVSAKNLRPDNKVGKVQQ